MRVAVIVALMSVLTTSSEASKSCMTRAEAQQHFGTVYLYWHGPEHCWDATPMRRHGVRYRVRHPEPEPTPRFVVPMPSPDLRRSANAMATDELEAGLITVPTWVDHSVNFGPSQPPLDARWVDIVQVAPPPIIRKSEPMVSPRDIVIVLIVITLTLAIVVIFERPISRRNERS